VARAAVRLTCNAAVVVAAFALVALAVGPHVLGYRTVVMRTGSMEPSISPGDILVIKPEPVSRLHAVEGSPVYSHRVAAVRHRASETVVTTKGDANSAADPWLASITDRQAWHVVRVVPGVGWVVAALHRPAVHLLSVWLIPSALCAEALLRLWRRPTTKDPLLVDHGVGS